jgi:hypothetical protein
VKSRSPPPPSDSPGTGWPRPRRPEHRPDARAGPRSEGRPRLEVRVARRRSDRPQYDPAVAGDTVYVTEHGNGTLVALDIGNGSRRWVAGRTDDRETTATAVTDGPDLALAGRHGMLSPYSHAGVQQLATGKPLSGDVRGNHGRRRRRVRSHRRRRPRPPRGRPRGRANPVTTGHRSAGGTARSRRRPRLRRRDGRPPRDRGPGERRGALGDAGRRTVEKSAAAR